MSKITDDLIEYFASKGKKSEPFTESSIQIYQQGYLLDDELTDIFEQFFVVKIVLPLPEAEA